MNIRITNLETRDIRFPTSESLDGSDAMNPDPDYSAAYVILRTNVDGLEGHGLTFTIGRGNDICVAAIQAFRHLIIGKSLEDIVDNMAGFWREIHSDSQLRWLGPEKGVIHLATGAIVNAVWDLYAKKEQKPLWRLIYDMSPEKLVSCIDFTYLTDAITTNEALKILHDRRKGREVRYHRLKEHGYPAYITSAGWLGYDDEKIVRLCKQALEEGWTNMKMKVGTDIADDVRRAELMRSVLGYDIKLMTDANQKWEVSEAIDNMKKLAPYNPYWIEEPTSPDDILGHKAIRDKIGPIKVATGEHCQNRVIFKQLITCGAIDVCQVDSARIGGVNEILAVMLLCAKYDVPVCPHAGGVGLCEYVQHLSIVDYLCISGEIEGRMIEYVNHLHEHFVDPVVIKKGHYMMPVAPGYSITIKDESLETYEFPTGQAWKNSNSPFKVLQ